MASFWKALKNKFRQQKDAAAEALADPIRDGKYAIEDSKKKLAEIQTSIAKYSAQVKKNQRVLETELADVKKWTNLAKQAADANNADDVRKCVTEKNQAQARAENLKKQIKSDENYLNQMKTQWQARNNKVSEAESNHAQLSVRQQMAVARKEFAKGAQGLDSDSCFAELDKLKSQVEENECEAEAYEDMAPCDDINDMAAKYGSAGDSAVDEEVARIMASVKK